MTHTKKAKPEGAVIDTGSATQPTVRLPRRTRGAKSKDRRDACAPIDNEGRPSVPTEAVVEESQPDQFSASGEMLHPYTTALTASQIATVKAAASADGPSEGESQPDQLKPASALALPEARRLVAYKEDQQTNPPVEEPMRLSPEMKNAFKRFRESETCKRSSRVANALSQLSRIRLPYPRQIEAMAEIEELRLLGQQMKGEQQLGLTLFERTGTGKSTLARQYKLMCAEDAAEGTFPVIHARLGTSGSARDLYVSIMSEIGDGFPTAGTEHTLRRRAMQAMQAAGVELLILDETQHAGHRTGFSSAITAELKILLDIGHVPVVLLGTEQAVPLIRADRELAGRMFSPCRLSPLMMDDEDDFDLWTGLLGGLDTRMVADEIVAAGAGLAEPDLALALGDITDGIIGQFMRVMAMALRNTVRGRREVISMDDLILAVDEWSIENGFTDINRLRLL